MAMTTTPVDHVLTGLQVGLPGATSSCCACGSALQEGETVVVYAYQRAEGDRWNLSRVYCSPECYGGSEVRHATLGVSEALANATLAVTQSAASQTSHLALAGIELVDHCPPDTGSPL